MMIGLLGLAKYYCCLPISDDSVTVSKLDTVISISDDFSTEASTFRGGGDSNSYHEGHDRN